MKNSETNLLFLLFLCANSASAIDYSTLTKNPVYAYALALGGLSALGVGAFFAGIPPKTIAKIGVALTALYGSYRFLAPYWPQAQREQPKNFMSFFPPRNKEVFPYNKKIERAAFNANGTLLAIVDGNSVHVYNTTTLQNICTITLPEPISLFEFHQRKDEILVVGTTHLEIRTLHFNQEKQVYQLQDKHSLQSAQLSSYGDQLLLVRDNRVTIIDNYSSENPSEQDLVHDCAVQKAAFGSGGEYIVTLCHKNVYVWSTSAPHKPLYSTQPYKQEIVSVDVSPHGKTMVTLNTQGTVYLWTLDTSLSAKKILNSKNITHVNLSTGTTYLEIHAHKKIYLLDPTISLTLLNQHLFLKSLFISQGYDKVFTTMNDQYIFTIRGTTMSLWNIYEEKKREFGIMHTNCLAISRDGSKILLQSSKKDAFTTTLWSQ